MEPAGAEQHRPEARRVSELAQANQTPYNFSITHSESPNPPNRGVQSAVRRNGLEPCEKGGRTARCGWRRDRKVFREAEVYSTSASEILSNLAEIRRDHAVDGVGLYPDMGLAVRARICPAPPSA